EAGQFLAAGLAGPGQDGFRPVFLDEAGDDGFEDHRMARDAPARIEAHLAFAVGKYLDPLGIEPIEARVGQDAPVGTLEVVQAVDLALALEVAGGIGKGLETLEEVAKGRFDMPFERLAMAAERFALGAFQPGEAQTVAQAG